jgi:hypothetical protein
MGREPEEWGGPVRLPDWLRRLLRRPAAVGENTPERTHEARTGQGQMSNAPGGGPVDSVLGHGALADLHRERRK